ncbi:nitroreductase/quinone reductase family protein [Streptomyces erythrochromogenes]|uniref:Nitroreductase/quinone reductase family protein n=1 Tax=Streptomyces erythrochromogenes TaxID=285574 RepID=A0ABZ1QE59_9ACTN|nr:nitroreductase/quinone reductase family protein [Streptomyces erythrochromogenes]MCX5586260.1 nitroreductase/quinone reductase family protein [Streptomyces erythrochromogenes]
MSSFNQNVIEEFRANAGKVGGPFEGAQLLLLTTTGARSGKPHTVPLGFLRDGGTPLVVASAAGADRHPAWYHNLLARPLVQVETGTEEYEAVAVPAAGARRDELFAQVVRAEPGYGEYQGRTARVIPVVALQRTHEVPDEEGGIAGKLLSVHGWLRAQLVLVRELAGDRVREGGAASLGLQLRQHCLAFCHTLEFHHRSEDAGLFPYLEQQHPHMREFFRRIGAEHAVIARLQEELVRALDAPGDGAGEGFSDRVERMSRELESHLDGEEAQLLPVLRALEG